MSKELTFDQVKQLSPKAQRKLLRRLQSDLDMTMHKAKPSMTGLTLTKLKNYDSKPINKDARLIVSKRKKTD